MLLFKVLEKDLKLFMKLLLVNSNFYSFNVVKAQVTSFINVSYDCKVSKDFLESEGNYIAWEILQPLLRDVIRSKKAPEKILITFILPETQNDIINENAKSCILNMKYENKEVIFTTSLTEKNFSLNRSIDDSWNDYVTDFFTNNAIPIIKENLQ